MNLNTDQHFEMSLGIQGRPSKSNYVLIYANCNCKIYLFEFRLGSDVETHLNFQCVILRNLGPLLTHPFFATSLLSVCYTDALILKLEYSEKATKFEKNLPSYFTLLKG